MAYNFTKFQAGKFEVGVDAAALYGYFEHEELGDNCGGGLWFEKVSFENDAGFVLELTDYDGVFELPKPVIGGLRERGFVVDSTFE